MKKLLLILTLMVGGYSLSYAQTPTDIYKAFSNEKDVVALNICGPFGKWADFDEEMIRDVESVMLLALNGCDESVKERFNKKLGDLQTNGYETLIRTSKDNKTMKVLIKANDDQINELLVLVTGEKPVLVVVKGTISRSELMAKSDKLPFNI